MSTPFDRRTFLRRSALGAGALALAGPLLAACGDDSDDSSSSSGSSGGGGSSFGTLTYQLSWIKNFEFAGVFMADSMGIYEDAGFDKVTLLPGGPNVQADGVIAVGKANFGSSGADRTSAAIVGGADLVTIGALYQKSPYAIASLADSPIEGPEDMIGKRIGVPAANNSAWKAFLKANEIDEGEITVVPTQFDPTPLAEGEFDGLMCFVVNEPSVLQSQGVETATFLLADHGLPSVSITNVVTRKTLDENRDLVKAALLGDVKGWRAAIADPEKSVDLTVNDYGKALNLDAEQQRISFDKQLELIYTDETNENGILTISDALQDEVIESLGLGGVEITKEALFDTTIIDEIYEENPDLKEPVTS